MVLPVSDPSWGPLLNNEQILIMMGVPLTHSLQDKIDGILSAHDGQVINYIPDQSLLAISKIDCVSALERIPGVIWAVGIVPCCSLVDMVQSFNSHYS